jgi:uncharacterized protein YggU (UPF0235/DUF167 family)
MPSAARPWRASKTGVSLLVRVTPKSSRPAIDGVVETGQGSALQVRVREVAEDGAANAAVEWAVAQWLGLAKTRVRIARGGKSRIKTIDISGPSGELETLLAARIAALQ